MKITKIKIRNLFGISEVELDGSSVEITGTNGAGKSSIIDAIRFALTNDSNRDLIIREGEKEGEILIETDTGLMIDRMKRKEQADYKCIKDGRNIVSSPESFLRTLFSELQIDPVAFINMSKKDQNRAILDLIDFSWDLNWIREQFGEIPAGVNYEQNILQVLYDIQAENSDYFRRRQDLNRDIRNKMAFIAEIASTLPEHYDAEHWESFDVDAAYKALTAAQQQNNVIARAQTFQNSYDSKKRGLEADREIAISQHRTAISEERKRLAATIARLEAELATARRDESALDAKLQDKINLEQTKYEAALAQLEKDMGVAADYSGREIINTQPMQEEIDMAQAMRAHLNEYHRMLKLQEEQAALTADSEELTRKIELARELPGIILQSATIPIDGLTVENGVPLINGLPVSNLSEGEKLELCVNVALSKPNGLQIILIDGVEKLSESNRNRLYELCRQKGVQFVATRTTDDAEMKVVTL